MGKLASLRFQPGRVSSLLAVASAVKKVSSDAQIDPPLRNPGGSCSRLMSLSWSFCCMPPASVWQVSMGVWSSLLMVFFLKFTSSIMFISLIQLSLFQSSYSYIVFQTTQSINIYFMQIQRISGVKKSRCQHRVCT